MSVLAPPKALLAPADAPLRSTASSGAVAHGSLWNLIGRAGPIAIALLVTPFLVQALGDERWGVFTIILSLVGAFGIFDFGLGRALTSAVSSRLGTAAAGQIPTIVATGLLAAASLGVIGGLATAGMAGTWVRSSLHISAGLQHEVLLAVLVMCASAPLVIINAAQWGVLSAYRKFRAANLINIPINALYYVGPLLVLPVWNSLVGVMLVLVGCRLITMLAYRRISPPLGAARPSAACLRMLLHTGGWMTVSTVMYPVLLYADRFVIASKLGAAFSGYYSTPFDLVSRFTIFATAIYVSAFPVMAGSFRSDPAGTVGLFRHCILAIAMALFPACLVVVGLSDQIMTLWIGPDFASHAAPVMRWLGLGILFTCIDGVVFQLIDSIGRPSMNAKMSLLELAIYLPLLAFLLDRFGIEGAAMAFAARAIGDFAIRLVIASRVYPPITAALRPILLAVASAAALLGLPLLAGGLLPRLALMAAAEAAFLAILWLGTLRAEERSRVREGMDTALLRARLLLRLPSGV